MNKSPEQIKSACGESQIIKPTDIMRAPASPQVSPVVTTEQPPTKTVSDSINMDRLEKKKNREKRRRSEVNERFEELVEVMDHAQSQLLNTTGYSNEYSKSILTKSDLLEKAVELVKALSEENKRLRTMAQGVIQPMQVIQPTSAVQFDPNRAQVFPGWPTAANMIPFAGAMYQPRQLPQSCNMDFQSFGQPQQFKMMQNPMTNMAVNQPGVLSYSDMAQLGDWGASINNFNQKGGQFQQPVYEGVSRDQKPAVALASTHPECA